MKKLILAMLLCGISFAETLPIENVTTLTGWFFEWRGDHQHSALDIPAIRYTPIVAVKSGTVINADWSDTLGNYIDIKDDTGIYRYGHLQNYKVLVGQEVYEGQLIATVGNTGRQRNSKPMGCHLHIQRMENGKCVYFTDRFIRDGKRVYWSIKNSNK